ncbi:hypothetical protein AVEN_62350-1 [Araneus ventricosus]|uniref:Uncharacterized protein n=1 Tax=Araneus ventricosus TaxID=182803 RepID=A0A4Y2K9S7_ARAVE|nr:hypothetical protein AVEN_62350-1 [Araneus ventricosus]
MQSVFTRSWCINCSNSTSVINRPDLLSSTQQLVVNRADDMREIQLPKHLPPFSSKKVGVYRRELLASTSQRAVLPPSSGSETVEWTTDLLALTIAA